MPEFVASFGAAAKAADDIAFGNVLGSNIANILMILGISALILPIATQLDTIRRDTIFVMISSLGCLAWIYLGGLSQGSALALFLIFLLYLYLSIRADLRSSSTLEEDDALSGIIRQDRSIILSGIMVLGGILILIAGAEGLIRGASAIARGYGVSEALIGITIVGIGTSLPEASASILASLKRENTLAFANVIGSNIFNGLAILGLTGLVFPLSFDVSAAGFSLLDGIILVAATGLMFVFARTHKAFLRWEGAVLLALYVGYLSWLIARVI